MNLLIKLKESNLFSTKYLIVLQNEFKSKSQLWINRTFKHSRILQTKDKAKLKHFPGQRVG